MSAPTTHHTAEPHEPLASDPPVQSPAIAKAKLLTRLLNQASRAGVSVTAHAVLAHLIADAWPSPLGSAWSASTPIGTLANRLGVGDKTIRRAVRELELAELVKCRIGGGKQPSVYLLVCSEPAPRSQVGGVSPVGGPPSHPREGPPPTHDRTPLPPMGGVPDPDRINHRSSSIIIRGEPARPPSRAAADAVLALIVRKPEWLPEGKPWIATSMARHLAELPTSTPDVALWALRATRESRQTLRNPAGFFISRMTTPDLVEVREDAARRERNAAIARQREGRA